MPSIATDAIPRRSSRGCDISTVATALQQEDLPEIGGQAHHCARGAERLVWLDVLRGVAILLVASGHMLGAFAIPSDTPTFARPMWVALAQLAVAGVDMFLVLSGFLIGCMLLSELRSRGTIDVARFYGRRALRIWPSYFLVVVFAWYWYRIVPDAYGKPMSPPRFADMWPFFLQIQNYYDLHVHNKLNIGAVMQTWTLVAIVHFYIVIPLLLLLLARTSRAAGKRIAALPWVVLAAFAACLWMRWQAAPANAEGYDSWKHYFPTHLRIDELLLGVLGAYWVVYARPQLNRAMRYWPLILIASIGALLPVALRKEEGPRFLIIWGYTLAGVGCMGLILIGWWFSQPRADGAAPRAPLPARWLAQVGIWSYSIYLWHQPAAQVLAQKVRNSLFNRLARMHYDPWRWRLQYFIAAAIYFAIAIGIGVVMYYLIERPSLIMRERILPRRALASESLVPQAIFTPGKPATSTTS